MNSIRLAAICALTMGVGFFQQPAADDAAAKTTRVKAGENAPDFTCKTISGEAFALGEQIYAKYAEQFIPRNFIVGKDGKIKLASMGYTESSFQEMVQTLENELKQPSPARQASTTTPVQPPRSESR